MARKKNEYRVRLGDKITHRITALQFYEYVKTGWLEKIDGHRARLRDGVVGWIENGSLRLLNTLTKVGVWIQLNCRIIENQAIFDLRGRRLSASEYQRELWRYHCVM